MPNSRGTVQFVQPKTGPPAYSPDQFQRQRSFPRRYSPTEDQSSISVRQREAKEKAQRFNVMSSIKFVEQQKVQKRPIPQDDEIQSAEDQQMRPKSPRYKTRISSPFREFSLPPVIKSALNQTPNMLTPSKRLLSDPESENRKKFVLDLSQEDQLRKDKLSLDRSLKAANKEITELKARNEEFVQQIENLQQIADKQEKTNADNDLMKKQNDELRVQIKALSKLEEENEQLKKTVEAISKQNEEEQKKKFERYKQEVLKRVNLKIDGLVDERDKLKKEVQELKEQLAQRDKPDTEIEKLNDRINELAKSAEFYEKENISLKSKLMQSESTIEQQKEQLVDLNDKSAEFERWVDQCKQRTELEISKVDNLQTRIQRLEKINTDSNKNLEIASKEIGFLNAECNKRILFIQQQAAHIANLCTQLKEKDDQLKTISCALNPKSSDNQSRASSSGAVSSISQLQPAMPCPPNFGYPIVSQQTAQTPHFFQANYMQAQYHLHRQ